MASIAAAADVEGSAALVRPVDRVAALASILISGLLVLFGSFLFVQPSVVVNNLFPCLKRDDEDIYELSELETVLSRLTGGVFSSLSLIGFLLVFPPYCSHSKGPCRVSLTSQALIGLLLVLVGVTEDIAYSGGESNTGENACGNLKVVSLLIGGSALILLACFGLMASFWPAAPLNHDSESEGVVGVSSRMVSSSTPTNIGNSLTEPLLASNGTDAEENSDTSTSCRITDANVDEEMQEVGSSQDDVSGRQGDQATGFASSRITGTRRLIKLAAPEMFNIYLGCAVLLVRLPFSIAQPHFVSTTLGCLSRQSYSEARVEILLLFLMGIIDAALDFWVLFLFGVSKENIVRSIRLNTFGAILRQDVAFFDSNNSGDLTSRLTSDCGEMAGDLTWFFRFSIESIVRITGVVTYMMIRSPTLGLCAISIVPLVGVINKKYGDWLSENAKAVQAALAEANSCAQEAFSCIRTVIAFASEDNEKEKYGSRVDKYYRLCMKQLYMTGFYYMIVSTFLINTCVKAALLFIGTLLIQQGRITTEVLLAFMLYQGSLQNETQNLLNSYTSLIKSSGAGDKVFSLLDRRPSPPGTGSPDVILTSDHAVTNNSDEQGDQSQNEANHDKPAASPAKSLGIELQNVSFSYSSRPDQQVLNNLSLDIYPGTTIALVGKSGCGKSTIISLLERFYDPDSGSILVGGEDLKRWPLKDHRKNVSIVTQEPLLFSGTIAFNILYGRPNATLDDVIEAAKMANCHDFISTFPDGYSTQVGERGMQLSGGQRQRIVIARAILKRPSILLLDEATSALDSESERLVQDALDHLLSEEMTVVIIAHRLATVRKADCIAVVGEGRIIEQGTHDELVKQPSGSYRRMVERSEKGQLPE